MVDPNIRSTPAFHPRKKARRIVADWVNATTEKTDNTPPIDPDADIYVVWYAKVLQNWKALLSTTRPDGMYYEVSYNGDNKEAYLDCYRKVANSTYPDVVDTGSDVSREHIIDGVTPCWCKPTIEYVHGKGRKN